MNSSSTALNEFEASFKFFVRAENLNFLWTDKETQVISGFPIPSVQIRMGLTWDFWN